MVSEDGEDPFGCFFRIVVLQHLHGLPRLVLTKQDVVFRKRHLVTAAKDRFDLVHGLQGLVQLALADIQVGQVIIDFCFLGEILEHLLIRGQGQFFLPAHGIGNGQAVAVPEIPGIQFGSLQKGFLCRPDVFLI